MSSYRLYHGDLKCSLKHLKDNSVQCIVTSPPYFGHRKYETVNPSKMEIGRETSAQEYVENLVSYLNCLKPKLKSTGLFWLNLGDTYRDSGLQLIPSRVALALVESGWILRSDVIWNKTNAMPSSVKNRPTVSHEYLFMFSKSSTYYYDSDSIREPHVTFSEKSKMKGGRGHFFVRNGTPENGKNSGNANLHTGRWDQAFHPLGRNKRTVWEIPLGKFRGSHFAVFPEKLVDLCIRVSSKHGDLVLDPFTGSGTTGVVAIRSNRKFVGFELYKKYKEMAEERIRTECDSKNHH